MAKYKLYYNLSYLVTMVMVVGLMASCGSNRERIVAKPVLADNNHDTLVAYIERTRCFGICPYYSIRIYRSGYVLYEGYDHVPNVGRFYTYLSKKQLQNIGEKAEELGYFELNDEYRNPHLTDFPTIYSEVRYRGKKKKITHYDADPPPNLVEMEKYLDSFFGPETLWQIHPVQDLKD